MCSGAMITSELLAASAEMVAPPALKALLPDDAGVNGVACAALVDGDGDDDDGGDEGEVPIPEPELDCADKPLEAGVLSWPVSIERSVCATFTASAFFR